VTLHLASEFIQRCGDEQHKNGRRNRQLAIGALENFALLGTADREKLKAILKRGKIPD